MNNPNHAEFPKEVEPELTESSNPLLEKKWNRLGVSSIVLSIALFTITFWGYLIKSDKNIKTISGLVLLSVATIITFVYGLKKVEKLGKLLGYIILFSTIIVLVFGGLSILVIYKTDYQSNPMHWDGVLGIIAYFTGLYGVSAIFILILYGLYKVFKSK